MTEIDQSARRAAEALPFEVVCGDSMFWLVSQPFRSRVHAEKAAAEFAPVHDRLAEAERLLAQAQASVAAIAYEFHYKKDLELKADIDKFLAAKEAERE